MRGNRIELGEIEFRLNTHPQIKQSVVSVQQGLTGDQRIVAYLETLAQEDLCIDNLREQLRDTLPTHMIPQQFVMINTLPLTPNGKLDRNALPEPPDLTLSSVASTAGTQQPQSRLEIAMADIWADVLGISNNANKDNVNTVPVNETFFNLGGHSLLAMQVIARVRKQLDIEIAPVDMVDGTIRRLLAEHDTEVVPVSDDLVKSDQSQMDSLFFANQELYGRFHKPPTGKSIRGAVLMCNPILMEACNIQWGYKRLANSLADAGYYVLRFDYFGCGNSWGEDEEGGVERWQQDINNTAIKLTELTGLTNIDVIGFRFGCTLASNLSSVPVNKFVLWEPTLDSTTYVNHIDSQYNKTLTTLNRFRKQPAVASQSETTGFAFTDQMRKSILNTDMGNASLPKTCASIHLITNHSRAHFKTLIDTLSSQKQAPKVSEINDKVPRIEELDDLSAWLPGKSLYAVVDAITGDSNA